MANKTISTNDIKIIGNNVKQYFKKNKTYPSKITINKISYNFQEYTYYLSAFIARKGANIEKKSIKAAPNPNGDNINKKVKQDEYFDMAKRVTEYVNKKGILPNSVATKDKKKRVNIILWSYQAAKIVAYYKEKNKFGSEILINSADLKIKKTTTTKKECQNPYTSSPHPVSVGCNGKGQNTAYYCAPSSIHKCIYKFGIRDITQEQIASWAGTTSAGTSHAGIETAIAKINKVKGTKISIKWYNFSDVGWEKLAKIICNTNQAAFCHILYKNGGTCSGDGNFGHYETLTKINLSTKYVEVLNSLGSKCGSCYCGYYQDRTMACQEQFMKGISQKSIAVLTRD